MRDIILGLKESEIITEKNVIDLKNYISKKYSGHDSGKISHTLADGINKIIDKKISQFDEENRKVIRNNLVRRAVSKDKFEINAYEVFCEIIKKSNKYEINIDALAEWINTRQEKSVDREEVFNLVSIMDIQNDISLDESLDRALDEIDGYGEKHPERQLVEKFHKDCPSKEASFVVDIGEVSIRSDGSMEYSRQRDIRGKLEIIRSYIKDNILFYRKKISIISAAFLCIVLITANMHNIINFLGNDVEKVMNKIENDIYDEYYSQEAEMLGSELPEDFRYIEIDRIMLKGWLEDRNSMLAEEPYFSSILDTAKRFDINPLLMISIAGQEQGFVPRNQINASKIANNPFNVYGSWQTYNTDIKDASEIAARTIINLSKGKPDNEDTIQWINRKYAEDKNWWVGVSRIYLSLKKDIIQ